VDRNRQTFLVLEEIGDGKAKRLFVKAERMPRGLDEDRVAYCRRRLLSYYDVRSGTVVERPMRRLRGAAGFVDALVKSRLKVK
jgi:hypothetical protein